MSTHFFKDRSISRLTNRDLHGPDFVGPARPVDLTARSGPAHGPEFEFWARPVSARNMAKPGPARPGPVRSNKAVSMGFLETIQFN